MECNLYVSCQKRNFFVYANFEFYFVVDVSEANKLKDEESAQLKTLLRDLKSMPLQELSSLSIGIYV